MRTGRPYGLGREVFFSIYVLQRLIRGGENDHNLHQTTNTKGRNRNMISNGLILLQPFYL